MKPTIHIATAIVLATSCFSGQLEGITPTQEKPAGEA
jgi:hypothetical protein